jgi:hypothetical protein
MADVTTPIVDLAIVIAQTKHLFEHPYMRLPEILVVSLKGEWSIGIYVVKLVNVGRQIVFGFVSKH